ncbi:hypothetical protein L0128_12970 [candidate division KSB1 bacterium]|nr:hypothetical protein [candidate division KSB1 bacterium]
MAADFQYPCTPCRNFQFLDGTLIVDPIDQREKLALNNFVAGGKGCLVLVDYERDTAERFDFPEHAGGRTILQISPTRLILASEYQGAFLPFDLTQRAWDTSKMAVGPNNEYTWMLAPAADGWIYSGGYPHPNLYRYHPLTAQTEDLGEMFGERNLYNRFVAPLPDNWVLSSIGFEKFALVAFHVPSGAKRILPFQLNTCARIKCLGQYVLAVWDKHLHMLNARTLAEETPVDFPQPPRADQYWTDFLNFSTLSALYLTTNDDVVYRWRPVEKQLQLVWHTNLRGGWLVGVDQQDRLVGVRGQDYFVAPAAAASIQLKRIPAEAPATEIIFLTPDPKGGVIGGPGFGQTLFHFDPARKMIYNTATVVDAGGEVFDGKFWQGKFYFAAYSHADIGVWQPTEPWDQWRNVNPRTIASFYEQGVCRPRGGLILGPDAKIYVGFSTHYGHPGGGIAELDPLTEKTRLWLHPLPQRSISALATDGRQLFGAAVAQAEGMRPAVRSSYIFIFNPQTEKVVAQNELPEVLDIFSLCYDPETRQLLAADSSQIYILDAATTRLKVTIELAPEFKSQPFQKFLLIEHRCLIPAGNIIWEVDVPAQKLKIFYQASGKVRTLAYSNSWLYYSIGAQLYTRDWK